MGTTVAGNLIHDGHFDAHAAVPVLYLRSGTVP